MKNLSRALPILVIIALFPSCSGRITARLSQNGSGGAQIDAALQPNMTSLIQSFRSVGNAARQSGPLLDAAALNRSLQSAQGITSSALRNTGQEHVEGTITISNFGGILSSGANRFVQYEAGASSGKLAFHLDRAIAPRLLAQIYPEAVDYLSALMAPAATGETLAKQEYLALVESVYSKALALEITHARIVVVITLPGTVKSVKGGAFSGSEARFDIPLTDLLVLEQPLVYEIVW